MSIPLLFTPGPVPIENHLLALAEHQLPYNRTASFSELTQEILRGLEMIFQTDGSVALLTGSGTAAMEAAMINFIDASERVLIINGGTFGQRWCDLCDVHSISYDEFTISLGADLDLTELNRLLSTGTYSALFVNAHETSTGHLYDIKAMGDIAHDHETFFIVDAISAICADPFFMDDWHVDVAILSSQKALALPPGLSFVAMNHRAIDRLNHRKPTSLYFNLKDYLTNQQRGQVPYTPAISLMRQLHQRLRDIQQETLSTVVEIHRQRAIHFRKAIEKLPFEIVPFRSSNAITCLSCNDMDATTVVDTLYTQHNIVVAPNGGPLKSKVFRVAHMGAQGDNDIPRLIAALRDIAVPDSNPITGN